MNAPGRSASSIRRSNDGVRSTSRSSPGARPRGAPPRSSWLPPCAREGGPGQRVKSSSREFNPGRVVPGVEAAPEPHPSRIRSGPAKGRARSLSDVYPSQVLRGLPALLLSRVAAAALILALSGAAGLAPRASAAEHRCQCQGMMVGGHHVCSCPICRLNALRATAYDRKAPPSRRVAAMQALSREMARPENGGAPCCSSRCDDSGGLPGVSPSADPFTLPRLSLPMPSALALEHAEVSSAPVTRDFLPDSPPPRSRRS